MSGWSPSDPARHAFAITPHDTNALAYPAHGVFVGTGGNITLRAVGSGADVVFKNLPSGSILPVQTSLVRATGTTAADLVALRNNAV